MSPEILISTLLCIIFILRGKIDYEEGYSDKGEKK
jgi:hypothetical protein